MTIHLVSKIGEFRNEAQARHGDGNEAGFQRGWEVRSSTE